MTKLTALAQEIWDMKYRLKTASGEPVDKTIADSWRRIAGALAAAEHEHSSRPDPDSHTAGTDPGGIRRQLGGLHSRQDRCRARLTVR